MRIDIEQTLQKIETHFSYLFNDVSIVEGNKNILIGLKRYKNEFFGDIELNIIVEKKDIDNNRIRWRYIFNPENKMISEKLSYSNTFLKDVIHTIEYLDFDSRYIDKLNFKRLKEEQFSLSKEQLDHYRWLKEAFSPVVSVASVASSNVAAGGSKKQLGGIGNDIINVSLIVY